LDVDVGSLVDMCNIANRIETWIKNNNDDYIGAFIHTFPGSGLCANNAPHSTLHMHFASGIYYQKELLESHKEKRISVYELDNIRSNKMIPASTHLRYYHENGIPSEHWWLSEILKNIK
jgi:hypothetical protein